MNVFLIQPPDNTTTLPVLESAQEDVNTFSPPWNVMCLQTFLQKHTRHVCRFIDCRLMHDLETELVKRLEELAPPRIMVVNCPILSLGQVSAVLEIAKRHIPTMRTVLCGEYPSAFPDNVADIPRADFALAGDPEPILRNLLDYVDVEPRLRRTPGLIMYGSVNIKPYWLPRLTALSLPDWEGVYWNDYAAYTVSRACRSAVRLTRGHSRAPAVRAHGELAQPLREWPMDRMAAFVNRCSNTEIGEVMMADPPGYWDPDKLIDWCTELLRVRNAQPWGLAMYPYGLSQDLIKDLAETRCKRIDWVFPSCDKEILARYGFKPDWRAEEATLAELRAAGITVFPRFWMGSPEEARGESDRIAQTIRRFSFTEYRVEPFPFVIDSPIYEEQIEDGQPQQLEAWIRWSRDPWIEERPVPLWGGRNRVASLTHELLMIRRILQRSPMLVWARLNQTFKSRNWIEVFEEKAINWLQRNRKASPL